jgi:hypothetical protein
MLVASLMALAVTSGVSAASGRRQADIGSPELQVNVRVVRNTTFAVIALGQDGVISPTSSSAVARVELSVPQGYAIDLARAPGTLVGLVSAGIVDATSNSSSIALANEELVVSDPAPFVTDPAAQACAPGKHAAVWLSKLSVVGQALNFAIFLDPAVGPGPSAYVLRFCPLWPPTPTRPAALVAANLGIYLEGVIRGPASPGLYTWSALLAPATPTFTPDDSRTFELRATVPTTQKITLKARFDAKAGSAHLSGTYTVLGKPQAGVRIRFVADDGTGDFPAFFGPVKTNAKGEFSITRKVDRTTLFSASAQLDSQACSAPTVAPGGCLSETLDRPDPSDASVIVRRASDPQWALRSSDQALARRANLSRADVPSDWEADPPDPFGLCPKFAPNLSDLTITGAARSPDLYGETAGASSDSSVFLTERQARDAFNRTATIAAARCVVNDLKSNGVEGASASALSFPRYGSATRAFRVMFVVQSHAVLLDLVSLRVGCTLVQFLFSAADVPFASERGLVAKVAARARS